MKRVFAIVNKLASRGRPFRGDDEIFGSLHNLSLIHILLFPFVKLGDNGFWFLVYC